MLYLIWNFKRYFWHIALAASLAVAFIIGATLIQNCLAFLFALNACRDFWRYYSFKSYEIVDPLKNETRTWKAIADDFKSRAGRTAFYGISRTEVFNQLNNIMIKGMIQQSSNNLCGPIAFLNFLLKHNPALFAKTFLEYYENGCTYAPFYLQSSFWDRYAYFVPVGMISRYFRNHYTSSDEALAGAFKNTYNLLGYNHSCLFEVFRGSTEPKQIVQWIEQAGFTCHSQVTIKNYRNSGEMPWLFRLLVGGVYSSCNKTDDPIVHDGDNCYLHLSQSQGDSYLHFMFNASSGHWTYSLDKNSSQQDYIEIHLPKDKKGQLSP